ncbi:MAG: type II toxin-antitoxin system RelE/ParE family toxin [Acidobacteriota bacterium]
MELIETPVFTRQVVERLSDEEYRQLQLYLVLRPDAGPVIPRSGGLRKLRWRLSGRGKRGGARVIYYWMGSATRLCLLFLYPKNVRSDLRPEELRVLRSLVAAEKES